MWNMIQSIKAKTEAAGYIYQKPDRDGLVSDVNESMIAMYVGTAIENMLNLRRYQEPTPQEVDRIRSADHDRQMEQQFNNLMREVGQDVELLDLDVMNYIRRTRFGLPEIDRIRS